jgi:hypothetical protein
MDSQVAGRRGGLWCDVTPPSRLIVDGLRSFNALGWPSDDGGFYCTPLGFIRRLFPPHAINTNANFLNSPLKLFSISHHDLLNYLFSSRPLFC